MLMPIHSCPRCSIGRLTPKQIPYTRVHEGMFISLPNVTIATCDVCGFEETDQRALSQLDALVGDFGAVPPENRLAAKMPPVEPDAADSAVQTPRIKP